MKVKKQKGIPYIYIQEAYSIYLFDQKLNKQVRKDKIRTLKSLGRLDKFDDGQPDFINRFREKFKSGEFIVPGVNDNISAPKVITISENDYKLDLKNIGYFPFDALYEYFDLSQIIATHKSRNNIDFDLNNYFKLLVFSRLLAPASKKATFENCLEKYGFFNIEKPKLSHVYQTLTVLDQKSLTIQNKIHQKIDQLFGGRDVSTTFYDVTNYYYEIDYSDEDSLRQRGVSKEKRTSPIVQMGMFIDNNKIPISYKLFKGNTLDQATFRPSYHEAINEYGLGRIVAVADRGLGSGMNKASLVNDGNGYIFSKSVRGSTKKLKEWLIEPEGYVNHNKGALKVKSMLVTNTYTDEDGNKKEIKERIVGYWSEKFYAKELREKEKFEKIIREIEANPSKASRLRAIKKHGMGKYFKDLTVDKETGEILEDIEVISTVNEEKIKQDKELMGYYLITTSETEMSDIEIIDKYRELSKIEESFKVLKGDLSARPAYVRTNEHINAHFLICFISLVMARLIHSQLNADIEDEEESISISRILKSLNEFEINTMSNGLSQISTKSNICLDVFEKYGISKETFSRFLVGAEAKRIKHKIKDNIHPKMFITVKKDAKARNTGR